MDHGNNTKSHLIKFSNFLKLFTVVNIMTTLLRAYGLYHFIVHKTPS
jgi:hypothetical protein